MDFFQPYCDYPTEMRLNLRSFWGNSWPFCKFEAVDLPWEGSVATKDFHDMELTYLHRVWDLGLLG